MPKWVWISGPILGLLAVFGCGEKSARQEVAAETRPDVQEKAYFVRFDVKPIGKQNETHWRYAATYSKGGKTARFNIEFFINGESHGRNVDDAGKFNMPGYVDADSGVTALKVKNGYGSISAESNSDDSVFLVDLKEALDASKIPSRSIRVRNIPFNFVVLGEKMTHTTGVDQTLVESDNGRWIGTKLFLGQSQESQVFFGFERGGGQGEFSLKASKYGDAVLAELAKVL